MAVEIICTECKTKSIHAAKGLCGLCYQRKLKQEQIVCKRCGNTTARYTKDYCKTCYHRRYAENKVGICIRRKTSVVRKDC